MSTSPLIEVDLDKLIQEDTIETIGTDALTSPAISGDVSSEDAPSDIPIPAVSEDVPSSRSDEGDMGISRLFGEDINDEELDILNKNEEDDFYQSEDDTDDNIESELSDFSFDDIIIENIVDDTEIVLKRETEVVEADYIQIEDYIDEVTRSKKGYISTKRKNIIQKEADNFIKLKHITVGINSVDNTFFVKRKTENYNPLLENILKQDYNNKRFIPVVHDSIKFYEKKDSTQTQDPESQLSGGAYEEKYFMINFYSELKTLQMLDTQYDEATSENYNYYKKLIDINGLIQPEFPFTTITSGFVKTMENDTFVLRNCSEDSPCHLFSENDIKEIKYDGKKLIGTVNNYDIKNNLIVVEEGQQHNVIGFLSIPTKYLFKLNDFKCTLNINETINNKYTDGIKEILNKYQKEIKISYLNPETQLDYILKDLDIDNDIHLLLLPKNKKLQELDEIYEHINHVFINNSHTDIVELFTHYANNNIMNLNYTIKELNIFLSTFNLELNDLTYNHWIDIKKLIQNSIHSISQSRTVEFKKLIQLIENYDKKLNVKQKEILSNDYDLISNDDIETIQSEVIDVYTKYFTDNTETRLRWYLENHNRSGILYLVKIQQYIGLLRTKLNISLEHFFDDIDTSATSLDAKLQLLETENIAIEQSITKLEEQIISTTKTDTCFKIRKIYSSMDVLKSDNRKSGILYDENLQVTGSDNIVKVGDYALLDIQGVQKYFKRDSIGSQNVEMWIVVDKLEYRNKCDESNTEDLTLTTDCLFNEKDAICESRPLVIFKLKLEENKRFINNIDTIKDFISSNKFEDLNRLIEYKLSLLSTNIKHINRNNNNRYKDIFQRLEEYKKERDSLEKYTDTNYLINNGSEEIIDFITDEGWGADGRMIVTRAVINETKTKPTTTLFTDVAFDQEIHREYVMSHIATNDEKEDNKFNINNILRTFIKTLDIDISKIEFTKIVEETKHFSEIYKILLSDFVINIKKLSKFRNTKINIIKKIYGSYLRKYTIIWTATRLLITLQTAVPNIIIRNTIKSCKMNLFGYPLIEEVKGIERNMSGIHFMNCILNLLKNSGGYWKVLNDNVYNCKVSTSTTYKCETIAEAIEKSLEHLYDNYSIRLLYIDKRNYLSTIDVTDQKPWKTFRPPLKVIPKISKKPPTVTKKNMIESNFNPETINKFKIVNYWSSLNMIYSIDSFIAEQQIDNTLYNPTPLNNSCCLYQIDNNYSSINFYKSKNDNIETLDTNKHLLKEIQNLIDTRKGTYFKISSSDKENREHSRYNFSEWIDDDELIEDFYLNFVDDGFFIGRKQIYDSNNVSTLTGKTKDEIKSVIRTTADKKKLEHIINKNNIIDRVVIEEEHNILSTVKKISDSNSLLKTNGYFNEFYKQFTIYIQENGNSNEATITREKNKLWGKISGFIDKIIEKITAKVSNNLSGAESTILLDNLDKLGDLTKTHSENLTLYSKIEANYIRNKTKDNFIKYYTLNTLRIISNKIANDGVHASVGDIQNLNDLLKNINLEHEFATDIYSEYTVFKRYSEDNIDTFNDISTKLSKLLNFIDEITSKETIHNCNNTVINSLFNSADSNFLLIFILSIIIQTILNIEDDDMPSFQLSGDDDEVEDTFIPTNNDDKIRCEFLNDFLKLVIKHQNRLDSLTQKNITKTIEQREEELKERNLQAYKDLNKEARLIQKELLRYKMDKWSNLATKERSQYQFQTDDDPFSPSDEVQEHMEALNQTNVRYVGEEDDDLEW